MKRPVWICLIGVVAFLTAEVLQVVWLACQATPSILPVLALANILLWILGSVFSAAYVDLKRKVNPAAGVGLFLVGSVGFALSYQLGIAGILPPTSMGVILFSNFVFVAWTGICLAVFALYPTLGKPNPPGVAEQSSG